MNSRLRAIWARMNHFEACLMVLLQKVDSEVLRMAIQLKVFLNNKSKQNGNCNVRNFRWFLYGMNPDVPTFKELTLKKDENSFSHMLLI